MCELDVFTASQDIKGVLRQGCMIHPEKVDRNYYRVYPDEGRKIEVPGEESKIEEMLDERCYVTNQDIREILKIQRFTATRIAKRSLI